MSRTPSSLLRPCARLFSSSSRTLFPPPASTGPGGRPQDPFNIKEMEKFQFDDATSLGHLRLQQIKEVRELVGRVDGDRQVLREQSLPAKFTPPTSAIKISSTIDLADPSSVYHTKKVLTAPLSALPLNGKDAVQRFKLIAGPRWTPGAPGRHEREAEGEGWIKISEERFKDGRQNRKSVSDMLERLVEAANVGRLPYIRKDRLILYQDEKSTLSADIPIDTRHLLSRQRKKRQRGAEHVWKRSEALKSRGGEVVGGVRGFPKEWLPKVEA
ncbi:hypothetical protein P7C73_g6484, partial [Tremellales sp. Uapishka_1]